ncbi:aromatic amino acid exporter YddG [Rhodoligotrophos ferricapiens]|uniref:aromatic amino acid exporter YddG n=1 Tax=Rhodoligotrophos ferricapiens TaxID=3069264 RepID=UPI00315D6E7B
MQSRELKATAIGIIAILLWASLALLTVSAGDIPRFELLTLTFTVAFVSGLAALTLQGRRGLHQLKQPLAPWLTAFIGIFAYHALYFFALSAAPPAQASLIAFLWPLLIVLLSSLAARQRLRVAHLAGALLGLAGTATLLLDKDTGPIELDAAAGYVAALACALVWSSYSVYNRRFEATPSGMLVGVCGAVALAGALCHLLLEETIAPGATQWATIIALGIGPAGLAFLAWDYGTKHGNLSLLGALSYIAPLVSTLLLIGAGRAQATWPVAIGLVLIIGGAVIATFHVKPRARTEP